MKTKEKTRTKYPRTKKRPVNEYKAFLRLSAAHSQTGIFHIEEPHDPACQGKAEATFDELGLPESLRERFRYWVAWGQPSYFITDSREDFDQKLVHAYAVALAIDLKRFLGDDYYVEYAGEEAYDELEYFRSRR